MAVRQPPPRPLDDIQGSGSMTSPVSGLYEITTQPSTGKLYIGGDHHFCPNLIPVKIAGNEKNNYYL